MHTVTKRKNSAFCSKSTFYFKALNSLIPNEVTLVQILLQINFTQSNACNQTRVHNPKLGTKPGYWIQTSLSDTDWFQVLDLITLFGYTIWIE